MATIAPTVTTKPKNSIVNVRIDPEVKERSEQILEQMGFSMSGAINSFLRQVIVERRLPYQPTTYNRPIREDDLTKEDLDTLLAEAANRVTDTSGTNADQFFKELSEEYGAKI